MLTKLFSASIADKRQAFPMAISQHNLGTGALHYAPFQDILDSNAKSLPKQKKACLSGYLSNHKTMTANIKGPLGVFKQFLYIHPKNRCIQVKAV